MAEDDADAGRENEDVDAIATQIAGIAALAPELRPGVTVVANGRNGQTTVTGAVKSGQRPL